MKRVAISALLFAILAPITGALSEDHPTYDSLWRTASQKAGCMPADYRDFILVTCREELSLWYFTKPNHPAHPGVIERVIAQEKNGDFFAHENGWSFGPDKAQPAFKAWLAQIADLDRKMKEDMAKRRGN